MGFCLSCCKNGSPEYEAPDAALRRAQMAEAAEKRIREQESRGIKDIDKVKRQQKKQDEINMLSDQGGDRDAPLRWQVG